MSESPARPGGNGESLEDALVALRQSLRGYLRRRLHDPAQADDLLQEVFVKAVAAQRGGRNIRNWSAWLFAATRSVLADHYRGRAGMTEELDEDLPAQQADDERLHRELAECMRPFVMELAPKYRDTLLAVDLEGLPMRELAEREGVSLSAIKSRASRARAMIRTRLLACCVVEVTDGLVNDYHLIRDGKGCGPSCG